MLKRFIWLMSGLVSILYADTGWMDSQIQSDLACYQNGEFDGKDLEELFDSCVNDHLVRFIIKNGQVTYQHPDKIIGHIPNAARIRAQPIYRFLLAVASKYALPDVTFYVSMGDAIDDCVCPPIFGFCKRKHKQGILMPDFSAVAQDYQQMFPVGFDPQVHDSPIPFSLKDDRVVFRGTSCYHGLSEADEDLYKRHKRFQLAELSQQYPELIDAGITFRLDHWSPAVSAMIDPLRKPKLTSQEILNYKYQMWIDGHVTSYTGSGWRLYSGSCVIKPDSEWVQWYFSGMKESVHYIGVREDLTDLVDTLRYLHEHQDYAEQVGRQGLQFVRERLSAEANLLYMYKLLCAYANLPISQSVCIQQDRTPKYIRGPLSFF